MSENTFVERPGQRGHNKYGDIYKALEETIENGKAFRLDKLPLTKISAIRAYFQSRHAGVKVRSRTIADSTYLWAERVPAHASPIEITA